MFVSGMDFVKFQKEWYGVFKQKHIFVRYFGKGKGNCCKEKSPEKILFFSSDSNNLIDKSEFMEM